MTNEELADHRDNCFALGFTMGLIRELECRRPLFEIIAEAIAHMRFQAATADTEVEREVYARAAEKWDAAALSTGVAHERLIESKAASEIILWHLDPVESGD